MQKEVTQLDIEKILRDNAPNIGGKIPAFVYRVLERLICQKRMNYILRKYHGDLGSAFATSLLKELNVTTNVIGLENIPQEGRFIFASNHPLGGLDGVALVSILGPHYDEKIKFLVNSLLMFVEPLAPVFLPINKYGSQAKEATEAINRAYDSDEQMLVFPAGMVSRLQNGAIDDLVWKKAFINKAVATERDIIPMYFEGRNTSSFYRLAQFRKWLKVPFNIEMTTLPREMFRSANKTFTVYIGKPIPYTTFDKTRTPDEWAKYVKDIAYALKPKKN